MGEPGAGREEQRESDGAEDGGSSEVRLEHQERAEDPQHEEMRQDPDREEADAVLLPGQRAREPEHERDLRQLAGLERHRTEPQPSGRAARAVTQPGQVHAEEQRERDEHQGNDQRLQAAVPELHRAQQRGEPDQRGHGLPLEEPERIAEARPGVHGARAVDHDDAEGEEQQHGGEQHRVVAQHRPQLFRPLAGHARSGDGRRGHASPRTSALN